jgi:hypothetical protein
MKKDDIVTALEKILDKSLDFKSIKKYFFQLASDWPTEKLIELLVVVAYRISIMTQYQNTKMISDGNTKAKSFGSILCPLYPIIDENT